MIGHNDHRTILVVDDDRGLNTLMCRTLEKERFSCASALNGADAIDWLGQHQAHLMLLDFKLPDMLGQQVVEKLRQKGNKIPFVVITGQGDERMAVDMMKRGARDYLVKDQALLDLLPRQVGQILEQVDNETKLAETEQALRRSEHKYRELVELAQEGIWALDDQAKITFVNPCMADMLGYAVDHMVGRSLFDFIHKDDLPLAKYYLSRRGTGINEKHVFDFIHRDGTRVHTRVSTATIFDQNNHYRGSIACIVDVTEQKRGEQVIMAYQKQLRSLASELALAEERERRRIAIELHDRIGQALIFSKMSLDALRDNVEPDQVEPTIREVCQSIDKAIQDTRSLTFDLSSPTLYEFGLEAAAEELLSEHFKDRKDITTQFHDDGQPKPLAEDIRILLFQVIRELVVNIVKHAEATLVKLSIFRHSDHIRVLVEDNGVGFEMPKSGLHMERAGGFGLFSIRERLDLVGGHLEIDSQPGQGTRVVVTAPLGIQ